MHWQLQEAKNKLSKVVQEARTSGPQTITVRGEEAAVVISPKTYCELIRRKDSLVALRTLLWSGAPCKVRGCGKAVLCRS